MSTGSSAQSDISIYHLALLELMRCLACARLYSGGLWREPTKLASTKLVSGRSLTDTDFNIAHDWVPGTGSWARQKQIMNQKLARRELFVDLVREFRMRFNGLADELQSGVQAAVRTHLGDIRLTLDMIRSDNVATESEQNPEFRLAVDAQVTAARAEVQELKKAFVPAG